MYFMKSTRFIAAILALVMILTVAFTSCGTPEESNTTEATTAPESENTTVITTEDNVEDTTESTSESTADNASEITTESETVSFTETETESSTHTETTEPSFEATTSKTDETTTEENEETTTEENEETTTMEETTTVITDVMIGETIEAEYAADFSVSRVFSNDMVVQRGEHIRVWGFAPESENGKKVSGEFKGMFAEALIENGEWCLTFGARLEADTHGAEMKIYAGENKTVTFTGVLVGDVYMVVGQSNVEYGVSTHISYADAATQIGGTATIDPNSIIRLNRTSSNSGGSFEKKGTDYIYKDLLNPTQWTKTTESETRAFSAVGYYFAKQMVEKTNGQVPVGVIEVGFSGAPLGSFLPNEVAEKYDTDYLDPITGKYMTTGVNANRYEGRGIYNCHLAPFEKYAIAGLIWYQGESNNSYEEASKYNEVFASLMTYMRGTHNVINKDFPIFIMEFPSIYKMPADYSGSDPWHFMELGIIRSFMGSIPTILKNSYVSVSNDLWTNKTFHNSLHPNCKYEQAERLADLANVVICGNGTLDKATGPIYKSVSISEDKKTAVITFTNVGEGLTTKDGGTAVQGIVGFASKYIGLPSSITPISAEITAKDQITVTFAEEIKAVAYNFGSSDLYGETLNLCNSEGCPASAFLSAYKDRELGTYKPEDFKTTSFSGVKYKSMAIDTLSADGVKLFTDGSVLYELNAAGNRIELSEGAAKLSTSGWIGFGYEILMFGYSIDGGNAVFNTYPAAAGDAVIKAGGQYAKRFSISINISQLKAGNHTVDVIVLVDLKDGVAVKLLSFTLSITEKVVIPDGLDVPAYNAAGYGFKNWAVDLLAKDSTDLCTSNAVGYLKNNNNTVTVAKGVKKLRLYGWIAYQTSIDKFGYALDGVATIDTEPSATSQAVIDAGGEHAKRFNVYADISDLDVGHHTVDLLVRINMEDGSTAVLKIISFTLIIE